MTCTFKNRQEMMYILLISNTLGQLFLCAAELEFYSDEFIDAINREQTLWKAGKNFGYNVTKEFLKILAITVDPDKGEQFSFIKPKEHGVIPKFFDARKRWSNCKTLKRVPNQGKCANCWAAALAVTLSSRLCVQSRGKYDYELSMDHITRCCPVWDRRCANYGNGCYGGYANYFYKFWTRVGIVSGGYHGSYKGCRPYSDELFYYLLFHPKGEDGKPSSKIQCIKSCSNEEYKKPFHEYKVSGYDVNYLRNKKPMYIQLEIMNNGPVQANMKVYNDFRVYQDGIYFHHRSTPKDKYVWHYVMLIGWGEENGVKYWLACNTWGRDWGGLGGYFKIKRGNNECVIESRIYGPLFGFGRRSANKTVKTDTTSSSMKIRTENLVIVVNFLVFVMMNNILNFN